MLFPRALGFFLLAAGAVLHAGCSVPPTFVPDDAQGGHDGGVGGAGEQGCKSNSNCPVPAAPCKRAQCDAGKCTLRPIAGNALSNAQTDGDCNDAVCDDMGAVVQKPNDNDPPAAPDKCTIVHCVAGAPVLEPAVVMADGNPCTGEECDPLVGPVHPPTNEGKPCDNCNGTCASGTCLDDCVAPQSCDKNTGLCH